MAARVRKLRCDEETRARIQTIQLLNRLYNHAIGEVELSQTQVRAIEILLKKVLPDLSAVEHSGSVDINDGRQLSDEQLAALAIADSRTRAIAPPDNSAELN